MTAPAPANAVSVNAVPTRSARTKVTAMNVASADMSLAELGLVAPPTLPASASVATAMRTMLDTGVTHILSDLDGAPAVLTRADVDRVLPSPATSLAHYEVPARLERVTVRHALRGPSPVLPGSASVADAVCVLRAASWAPVVVRDGDGDGDGVIGIVIGIVTAEIIAEELAGRPHARALSVVV